MGTVMDVINFILDMGPSVMMPIILFFLSMFFRVKIGKAIRSSLTVGMGFIGINLVIGLLTETLSPVTEAMVENLGVNLGIMDVGWPAVSAVAFGTTSVVPWIFVLGIALNGVMLAMNWTKSIYIDMWNYWHFIFTSSFVLAATGSLPLAIALGLITEIIVLKLADWTAPMVQDFYGLPGVSLPHTETISWAPIGWVLNRLIDKIPGIKDIDADPEHISDKYGVLGEPLIVGAIMGLILGILGYGPNLAAEGIGAVTRDIINTSVTLGAVLLIFPKMVGLLMDGLIPISDGVQEYLNKRFPGKELYIGLDAAIVVGHPANVATAYLMVPITIVLAVILSFFGLNEILPFADLAVLPFLVIWSQTWSRGNIFRGVVIASVMMVGILVIGTFLAPMTTDLAIAANFDMPEGANLISSLDGGAHLVPWLLSLPFVWSLIQEYGPAFTGISIFILVSALVCYAIFFKQLFTDGIPEINEIENKSSDPEKGW